MKGVILAVREAADEVASITGTRVVAAVSIANRPLALHALAALRAAGVEDIAVVTSARTRGPMRRVLAGAGVSWIECVEAPSVTGALGLAREFLAGAAVAVHRGDALVLPGLRPFVAGMDDGRPDALLLSTADARRPKLRLLGRGADSFPPERVDAALGLFGPGAATLASELGAHATSAELAALGVGLETRTVAESWSHGGHVDDLLDANRMVLDHAPPGSAAAEWPSARIEGRVMIDPTAVIERSTVRGPAVIGAGAVITDAFVGPYSAIGDRARLEGAEIEHSIVLRGAVIRHPGRRLEASLIGAEATVSRDFGLPASLRMRVGERTEVWLA